MNKRLTEEDIKKIYEMYQTPEHVKGHCRGVTNCAMKLAKALNEHGHNLDLDLVYGAGMVHDAARTFDEHWNVMADKLDEMGYHDEASIVRVHMEAGSYSHVEDITEKDMICLGDRLVKEDTYVGIDERFDYIIEKARRHGVLSYDRIMNNKKKMSVCLDEIEKEIGCSIDDLFMAKKKKSKNGDASFQDPKVTEYLKNAPTNGLCYKRWNADYEVVILDENGEYIKHEGDIIDIGNRHFEITKLGKHCFDECELLKETGNSCFLNKGVCFGKKVAVVSEVREFDGDNIVLVGKESPDMV